MPSEILDKIEVKMDEIVDQMLENSELSGLREIKNAVDWYKETEEARKEPGKVRALVINRIKEKVLEAIPEGFPKPPEFLEIAFTHIISSKHEKDVEFDLSLKLQPFKVYLEFTVLAGSMPVKRSVLLTFQVDTSVNLKGVNVRRSDSENRFGLKGIIVTVNLDLLTPMIMGVKRVSIGSKEFSIIENLEVRRTENGIEARVL